jgi:AraC-like DNA-binding protein
MHLIRSATLLGFPEAAIDVGLDPSEILRGVGLDIKCMRDPDFLIPLDFFYDALALAAERSGKPDFAVRAASYRSVPDLGPVTLLMREAETVEDAMAYYTTHIALHVGGFVIQIDNELEDPVIVVQLAGRTQAASIQASLFAVAGLTMTIRWLIGSSFQPEMVSLSHPKFAITEFSRRFFNCPFSYHQIVSGIVLRRKDWKRPVITSTPYLRKQALKYLAPVIASPDSLSMRIGRLIHQMLAEGDCSAARVAEYLHIDRRTLTRRLEKEHETFSSILQRVRIDIALRHITNRYFRLADLAGVIGFEGVSSFSRWFHNTFGYSASEIRANPELINRRYQIEPTSEVRKIHFG